MAKPVVYQDRWFQVIGSLIASQLIDLLNREESLFERLTSGYFYSDLIGGFVIAYILWEMVRQVVKWLDKRYDWLQQSVQRISLQLLLGVIFPAVLSYLLTLLFYETWPITRISCKQLGCTANSTW